jgi:hypothetical protein
MDTITASNYALYERIKSDPELQKQEFWVEFPEHMLMNKYMISTFGRIWSKAKKRLLNLSHHPSGYIYLLVCYNDGSKQKQAVHRLVAIVFIPNTEDKPTVDHIDNEESNNNVMNLQWATELEQAQNIITRSKKKPERAVPILQLTIDGQVIQRWNSPRDAVIGLGLSFSLGNDIVYTCRGRKGHQTAAGYRWRYDNSDLPGEEWKVVDYSGQHALVSTCGRLKRENGPLIEGYITKAGYKRTTLGRGNYVFIHHLVCLGFKGNSPHPNMGVNHIDGNKLNNCPNNLEWTTQTDNLKHARETGLIDYKKSAASNSKPVLQYDLDGNLIAEFASIAKAADATGVSKSSIGDACNKYRGTSIARGYQWEFKDNELNPVATN